MGKTYKTQPDDYFLNDFSNYDLDETELDDELDSRLLDSSGKRRHSKRARHTVHDDRHEMQGERQLPADWFDSDTMTTGSRHHWR